MKKAVFTLILFISFFHLGFSQEVCACVAENNFKGVEKIVAKKVRQVRRDKKLKNNVERMDSLERWMQQQSCVKDAYWNKNDAFILTTIRYVHQLGVSFVQDDQVVEKCFSIQTSYYNYVHKWGRKHNRLIYRKMFDCEGFIEQRREVDRKNGKE